MEFEDFQKHEKTIDAVIRNDLPPLLPNLNQVMANWGQTKVEHR
jgi:hypothetical protein